MVLASIDGMSDDEFSVTNGYFSLNRARFRSRIPFCICCSTVPGIEGFQRAVIQREAMVSLLVCPEKYKHRSMLDRLQATETAINTRTVCETE